MSRVDLRYIGRTFQVAGVGLAVAALSACESNNANRTAATSSDSTSMSAQDNSEGQVERRQMEILVDGADYTQDGSTITLDYPVLVDKNDRIPDWVINPGLGGVLGALGVAPLSSLGTKEQLNEARLNARLELAFTLESRIQSVGRTQLEQQLQGSNGGVDESSRKGILNVDRNISDVVLAGSRQRALWFDPENGECYVWVVVDGKVLEMVDHYVHEQVSVFLANSAVPNYVPTRTRHQPPRVTVNVTEAAAPPPPEPDPEPEPEPEPEPVPTDTVDGLEERMNELETIPIKEGGEGA